MVARSEAGDGRSGRQDNIQVVSKVMTPDDQKRLSEETVKQVAALKYEDQREARRLARALFQLKPCPRTAGRESRLRNLLNA